MSAIIYLLTNTLNGKQYVGQTTSGLDRRWYKHCWSSKRGSTLYLHNAIRKYGPDAFTQQILETLSSEDVNDREIYWIDELKTNVHGYNMTQGGGGMRGFIPSEETRMKIGKANKGKTRTLSPDHCAHIRESLTGAKHPNYGKHLSSETRAKISDARAGNKHHMYGKTHTPETCAKISAAMSGERCYMYGQTKSQEIRDKIRDSLSGKKSPWYNRHHSSVSKEKIRRALKGKPKSSEHRAKLRDAAKLRHRMKRIQAPTATIVVL